MIVGVFLRNYKTYQNINYVPLSTGETFCGLVGVNGVGKSSILECLDSFFNNKSWIWNLASKKQGQQAKPYIVPIFLIEKSKLIGPLVGLAEDISRIMWDLDEKDVASNNKVHFEVFRKHRELIIRNFDRNAYFLLPLGRDIDGDINISIFNRYKLAVAFNIELEEQTSIPQDDLVKHEPLNDLLKSVLTLYEYLYIPQDIDPNTFVKLETHEIQVLMGQTLNQIIEGQLPQQNVRNINSSLQVFLDELSNDLKGYSFRTPTDRQIGLRKGDFNSLIIEHFFETRKLHKQEGSHWIDIKDLSSGEKQKAIIDLAHSLITKRRINSNNLILAIDEPESSLHISSCFEQFLLLHAISSSCHQLVFSTHWYGFFPTIDDGFVSVINRKEGQHVIDFVSLGNYREEIKQQRESSKGKLPYDIRLKSINDFSQSIIASLMSDNPFNWIICEGSSEKLYLETYLSDLIHSINLRIIPVGGAAEIKRIYSYLANSFEDFRAEIKGKIFLLSDTDRALVSYNTNEVEKLNCKRIVNDPKTKRTNLVSISSNIVSPETVIEDCLNGRIFHETLLTFKPIRTELSFLDDTLKEDYEINSYYYFDHRQTEKESLHTFFSKENSKWYFAKKYTELLTQPGNLPENILKNHGKNSIPPWIAEIRMFLENKGLTLPNKKQVG